MITRTSNLWALWLQQIRSFDFGVAGFGGLDPSDCVHLQMHVASLRPFFFYMVACTDCSLL